jgi:hypothetical protein
MYELGRDSPDPVMRMLADQCMGVQNWHLGRLDRAGELMTLVDAAVRSLSPDDLTRLSMFDSPAFFTAFALHILELSGRSPEADERFEQLYRAYTTPYEIVVVVNFAAFSAVCAGDAERALKWARRGIAQDNGRDFGMFGATAQMYGGWALAVLQDPDEGLALLERGLERFRAADAKTAWGALVLGHVEALLAAERPVDQVRDILQVEAAEAEATREPLALPYIDLARAQVAAASGAPAAEVASLLTRAIDAARKGGNALLLERASRLASQLGVEPSAATVIGRQRSTAAGHVPNEAALQP